MFSRSDTSSGERPLDWKKKEKKIATFY